MRLGRTEGLPRGARAPPPPGQSRLTSLDVPHEPRVARARCLRPGLDPEALLAGVTVAMQDSLLDELDWLSAPSAAVALWEIANALPIGPERRDLGRRVVRQLHDGNAATFVAIATALALGARKGLRGRGVRARVSLCLELPTSEAPGKRRVLCAQPPRRGRRGVGVRGQAGRGPVRRARRAVRAQGPGLHRRGRAHAQRSGLPPAVPRGGRRAPRPTTRTSRASSRSTPA